MDIIINIFIYSLLPIGILFLLERSFLLYLINEKDRDWVQRQRWLHPNFISRCRYPAGFLCVVIFHFISPYFGIIWFGFWMITDLTDGSIARHFNLFTEKGEIIDPLSDKLLYFPLFFYMSYLGLFPLELVITFAIFDFIGQFSRLFIDKKAANLFGKTKTFMACICLLTGTIQIVYIPEGNESELIKILNTYLLGGTVFLSFCSMFFKVIPNYWYANLLSLMNFLCGAGGIYLAIIGHPAEYAFSLVFFGQFLDLFDGRAAERWGSTPRGELFDDLADGTNFGGTIGFIIYSTFENHIIGIFLGVLHFSCTTYRLIRFIKNKREAGIEGGVNSFMGLPSPAAALISGSAVILFNHYPYLQAFLVIISSFLMVSKIPYIHFGRIILPATPKMLKVLVLTLFMVATLLAFLTQNMDIVLTAIFAGAIGYAVFAWPIKKFLT